jgi:hypothetical protein
MITPQTVVPERLVSRGGRPITQTEATLERRIDSLEAVEIGGTTQWVLLRGYPSDLPRG